MHSKSVQSTEVQTANLRDTPPTIWKDCAGGEEQLHGADDCSRSHGRLRRHRALAMLWSGFLVILIGLVWGLTPALARMASGIGANPLGLAISAVLRLERATPKRLVGVLVCIAGAAIAIVTRRHISGEDVDPWLIVALLVPFFFAVQGVLIATRHPRHMDVFAGGGMMMSFSAAILFPIAYISGQLFPLGPVIQQLELLILLMAIGIATSILLVFHITIAAGPVFASLKAYTICIAGVFWGTVLLNEQLTLATLFALATVLAGMCLVAPRVSADLSAEEHSGGHASRIQPGSGNVGTRNG